MISDQGIGFDVLQWVAGRVESSVATARQTQVLIVKLGWTETLAPDPGLVCSLGDVLRTTPLLHLFVDDHVTWLTDERAVELLPGEPYINELVTYGSDACSQLAGREFDRVINLECDARLTEILTSLRFAKWNGFPAWTGQVLGHRDEVQDVKDGLLRGKTWPEVLFEMVGSRYAGESMILGGLRRSVETYDIGFNMKVGAKWPTKAWPDKNWQELAKALTGRYTFDFQRHLNDLSGYIDWVNSCRLLVTNDSLGMHIAQALGKKTVALFGPTSFESIPRMDSTVILHSEPLLDCQPCYRSTCERSCRCMRNIGVGAVAEAIERLMA